MAARAPELRNTETINEGPDLNTTTGSSITSDGVKIAWDRRGKGLPLVLLHGFTDYRQLMEPLAVRLGNYYDIVNIDLRGHGESSHNDDFSFGRLAADIVEVCADLQLHSPVLVGHSLGALLSTMAATAVAAPAVVNIDQTLNLNATARRLAPIASLLRNPAKFHATLDALFAGENTPGLSAGLQAELDQCAWQVNPKVVLGIWATLLDGETRQTDIFVEQVLATVTMPYLLYLGSDPGQQYLAWLQDRVPSATIDIYPGEYHFLHLARPDRVVNRIRDFIAGSGASSQAQTQGRRHGADAE